MQHNVSVTYNNVRLRPISEEDIEQMRVWRNLEFNRKWFTYSSEIDPESQKKWYKSYLAKEDDYMFAIDEIGELNRMIGTVAIYDIDKATGMAECGRFLIGDAAVKGKGLGKISMILCLHLGFKYLGVKKYHADVYIDNIAALKADHYAGFVDVGLKEASDGKMMQMIELEPEHFYSVHPFTREL